MAVIDVWNGPAVVAAARAEMIRRLRSAGQLVVDETKRLLNRSQPTTSGEGGKRRRGLAPSKPGEPPKRLEGLLISSIAPRLLEFPHELVLQVGTPVVYARRLELGFIGTDTKGRNVKQAPRPYLRKALANVRHAIPRVLGAEAAA